MYFRCVFLLLAVAVVRSAFPQNIRRITHRDGLSNSSILSLAQDADGYIWAGSCDGLNLWDGNSARHFRLSGNLIQEIVATDDGYLWVRTNYGVDRFDTRDRRIEMLAGFQRVYKFAARSRDEAFFLHGNKLYGYVASQGAFEPVDVRGAELNGVLRMCLDGDGVLWLVRSEDIRCAQVAYDAGGRASVGEWERMPLPDGVVFTCYDGDRTIFFTDRNGMLFRFDTGQRRAFPIFDLREELGRRGALSSVISDKDDYVLAFGMSGVLRLRSTDPIEGRYELQEIDVNCGVFALLKDCNQDIVWIGTDGSGLLRQAVGEVAIRSVTYETLPYLLTKPIKALHVDPEGDLWIGTKNDGILRIRDFYSRRTFTRENTDSYTAADSPLGKNSVYTFAGSRRNVLWIGGDGGVCYYSYRHRRIFELPRSGALRRIHGLYEDRDGVLWAASVGYGVWRVELSGSADAPVAANVEPVELGLKARSRNFFFSVCEESDSTLWFCNHGIGVVHYDRRTREGRTVGFDTRRGLAVNDVTAGVCRSDGSSWFGTGCGLVRYDPAGCGAEPDYSNDQLRCGVIHGLLVDSLDNIWVGTNAGIVRYDPATNRSVVYGASYGLDVVEFSDGAYFYDRERGKLLFGGINGFVVISDSGDSEAASYMPPIRFREVRANGESYDVGTLMRRGRMVLRHHQNAFSLSIAALDYVNGSNYSYFYNIEGLDGDWHDNYHSNTLAFAAFPTGRYTLGVRYRNNTTGEWSPVSRLPIRVLAPPYASTWAWIGYLAATLGVVIGVSGYLIRRRRLRTRLRQSLYEQRQRELVYESCIWSFSNLTNELSIPVTLINGPCQQIMGCKSADAFVRRQAELIRHNAQKINDLIYMLNEFQSTDPVDGSDDIEMLDVSRTAGGIAQTFADYAGENRIAYRTAVGSGVLFPSVRNILMMIFNILLSNAFRRTEPGGEVSVSVGICSVPRPDGAASGAGEETSGAAERLRIEVSNRGVELDAGQIELIFDRYKLFNHLGALSRQGVSLKEDLELTICYNLVTKLQGEFRVESRDGLTTFTLSLPRLEITRAARSAAQPDIAPGQRFSQPVPVPEASVMTFGDMLPTMLVINEDRDMADFIAGLFSGGYNVRIVSDLKCPQEKLAEAQPQIIICGTVSLNAAMIGLIRSIRETKQLMQVPIILLTAVSRTDVKVEGLELGVDICLKIPFDITHLQSVVDQLLRRYESLKSYGRSVYSAFDLTQGRLLHKDDKAFLERMLDIINRNILDPGFSTQFIARELGMSLCNFYRRLGTITGQTPAGIIREYRLNLAEQLLVTTRLSIDEIIYKSGFANRSTFFRGFIARFGATPKVYRERKIEEALREKDARAEESDRA